MITPHPKELPAHYANRLGIDYASSVDQDHKKKNGQFFTPIEIAELMAAFSDSVEKHLRILDPGSGTAILACALIEKIAFLQYQFIEIDLTVYETDADLIPYTECALNYLKLWSLTYKIKINYSLLNKDFVLVNAEHLHENGNLFSKVNTPFDIIISNPPYFKLPIDDDKSIAAKSIINGHPNIYALFMAISASLLKENGELIFITPRSFASGYYFKLFREYFFGRIEIDKVYLFISRKDAFSKDKVLQETVIIKGTRKMKINNNHIVSIFSSNGLNDINNTHSKSFKLNNLIDLSTKEKILYLPINDFEESILSIFKGWTGNLNKYNIQISTGPVVAFRALDYIQENYDNELSTLAPLFWLHNIKQMILEWPISKPNKGQYIKIKKESKSILILNKNYVFLRRFSSKDDKSRLIAAPYFCNFIESGYIGVENKVNYIYRPNGHLERNEVVGICALLNSTLFDAYFRIFNGNVNVSATELRDISLPPLNAIKVLGDRIIYKNDFSVNYINTVVNEYFEFYESFI